MKNKILELFLFNNRLKFNEIEKQLKIRSNKLTYHLKQLIEKNILTKQNQFYTPSETFEYLIPYLSDKTANLPVILIHIGNKTSSFLIKRNKKPFLNMLSLPGGRIQIKESIEQAAKRIIKNKYNLNIKLKQIHSISLEHVKKSNKIIHSFLLILVSAETQNPIKLININKNKSKIIPSDYYLLKNNLNQKTKIKTLETKI